MTTRTVAGVAGTSLIGINILLFLIPFILADGISYVARSLRPLPSHPAVAARALFLFLLSLAAAYGLYELLILDYVAANPYIAVHIHGIRVEAPLTLTVLGFRRFALPRAALRSERAAADPGAF